MARKERILIFADNATDVARQLIQVAGGVQAAHDAVTRAAAEQPRGKRGRPSPHDDAERLVLASAIQRAEGCSRDRALWKAVEMYPDATTTDPESTVRRLRGKIKGWSLAAFAESQPLECVMVGPRSFDFRMKP